MDGVSEDSSLGACLFVVSDSSAALGERLLLYENKFQPRQITKSSFRMLFKPHLLRILHPCLPQPISKFLKHLQYINNLHHQCIKPLQWVNHHLTLLPLHQANTNPPQFLQTTVNQFRTSTTLPQACNPNSKETNLLSSLISPSNPSEFRLNKIQINFIYYYLISNIISN